MKNKMTWQEKLQHKYALSKQGATDMMYAFISAIKYCINAPGGGVILHG